jgi:heptosyltransferase II
MNTLVIKLNATGDVVRTTPLLRSLRGRITWITADSNLVLLEGIDARLQAVGWSARGSIRTVDYDLLINLEDDVETAAFAGTVESRNRFGAYLALDGTVTYTESSCRWFDMSLISRYGRRRADELKLENRESYQQLLFEGLGLRFGGERYLLPAAGRTDLSGDVAIAPMAGPVWPMKNWAYYDDLRFALERDGLTVNVLPRRTTLLEHLADIQSHRCLVSGDSLPMHLAMGTGVPCVTLFNCTSPWEIHDYGLQTKVISPLLEEYFYQRGFEARATSAIPLDEVLVAVKRLVGRLSTGRWIATSSTSTC